VHTENQLPRFPGSALQVPGGVLWVPHVEVELCCDNLNFGGKIRFYIYRDNKKCISVNSIMHFAYDDTA
jgi:hypothetical protein